MSKKSRCALQSSRSEIHEHRGFYNGAKSAAWGLPVAPASQAIFTSDETGVGQAATLNQDNSANGTSTPAGRRTVIQIYATGLDQKSPTGITGSLTKSGVKTPAIPVHVTIGGIEDPVQFAEPAGSVLAVAALALRQRPMMFTITPGT